MSVTPSGDLAAAGAPSSAGAESAAVAGDAASVGRHARSLFEKAAALGDVSALYWLGHAHRVGDPVTGIAQKGDVALQKLHAAAGTSVRCATWRAVM